MYRYYLYMYIHIYVHNLLYIVTLNREFYCICTFVVLESIYKQSTVF